MNQETQTTKQEPIDISGCAKTPISDLARQAREHYEEASTAIHCWNSIIPRAIDLWEQSELERERQEQAEKQWQHYEQSRSPEST